MRPGEVILPPLPLRRRTRLCAVLVIVATVLGATAGVLIFIGGAPSEPCPSVHVDPSCGSGVSQHTLFLLGLGAACLGGITAGVSAVLRRRSAAQWRFNPPPGWPAPPAWWLASDEPTATFGPELPPPPSDWHFWLPVTKKRPHEPL